MKSVHYTSIFIFFILSFVLSQTPKHVIVSYDYSGSMRMYGLTENDFQAWNKALAEVLFEPQVDLSGKVELVYQDKGFTTPLINAGDLISFLRIGRTVTPIYERRPLNKEEFNNYLPKRFTMLSDQETYVSGAELYFLREVARETNTIWVNVSDDDEDVGRKNSESEGSQEELESLRNDIHIVSLYKISINERVKISVRIRKPEHRELLHFEQKCGKTSFREVVGSRRSNKEYQLTKNCGISIFPDSDVEPKAIRNILLRISLHNQKAEEVDSKVIQPRSVPYVIASDLKFSGNNAVQAIEKGQVDYMYINAKYYYGNRWIYQNKKIPIGFRESGFAWWLWILLILLLIVLGIFVVKNLLKASGGDLYTIICQKKNKYETFALKKDDIVRFGRQAAPGTAPVREKIFNINASNYILKRNDSNDFILLINGKDEKTIGLGKIFEIKDSSNNSVEILIKKGKIPPPTSHGSKPHKPGTLGGSKPKSRSLSSKP